MATFLKVSNRAYIINFLNNMAYLLINGCYFSSFVTLEDGDIVMTGTPKGVGEVVANSEFIGKVKKGDKTLVSALWLAS